MRFILKQITTEKEARKILGVHCILRETKPWAADMTWWKTGSFNHHPVVEKEICFVTAGYPPERFEFPFNPDHHAGEMMYFLPIDLERFSPIEQMEIRASMDDGK